MRIRNSGVPLPRSDEPLHEWLRKLARWSRLAYARYRRRREVSCIRCGSPAGVTCRACGARVCNRCWVLSIETGAPAALCLDCTAATASERRPARTRTEPAELLRVGARMLGWALGGVAALSIWRHGPSGIWRLTAFLLQPAALLGAVPLALLLGALRMAFGRALAALLAR